MHVISFVNNIIKSLDLFFDPKGIVLFIIYINFIDIYLLKTRTVFKIFSH